LVAPTDAPVLFLYAVHHFNKEFAKGFSKYGVIHICLEICNDSLHKKGIVISVA